MLRVYPSPWRARRYAGYTFHRIGLPEIFRTDSAAENGFQVGDPANVPMTSSRYRDNGDRNYSDRDVLKEAARRSENWP